MGNVASRADNVTSSSARIATHARSVRVWDLPTRLFHWSLLACVAGAVASAQAGGNWMEWHVRFGAGTLGLLAFRIVWGFVGPRYARFKSFLYSPRAILTSLKRIRTDTQSHAGHSPSGALSVYALLCVLFTQSVSGLFSSDSISIDGPLVSHATEASVSLATSVHVWLQWMIYGLVAMHVVAVFAYLVVKKYDLIGPMVHGDKQGIRAPDARDTLEVRVAGVVLMSICVTSALWFLRT